VGGIGLEPRENTTCDSNAIFEKIIGNEVENLENHPVFA
jgi:hypothetical protein